MWSFQFFNTSRPNSVGSPKHDASPSTSTTTGPILAQRAATASFDNKELPFSHPLPIPSPASETLSEVDGVFTPADSASSLSSFSSRTSLEQFGGGDNGQVAPLTDDKPISFGWGPDAWQYLPRSQRFDLTRGAPRKLYLDADFAQRNHRGCLIDPAKTLLVIVDMQNYFIHPACYNHPGGLQAVPPLLQVVPHARRLGIQVSFLNWVINDKDMREMPPAVQRGFCQRQLAKTGVGWHTNLGSELPGDLGRCLWEGTWNADLYDPIKELKRPDDPVFLKNRPSGMWSRDCDMFRYLEANGKKTIIFAGVNTDQCVLGTLTDSYSNGFDCLLLKDCTGTASGFMANELCEWNVATNYGFVTDSASLLRARFE